MKNSMKIRILGSGTSTGVPVIGCTCPVCTSSDPKNRRSRASLLIQTPAHNLLIDTATEFRLQALAAGIARVDGVFYTHAHADHIHGLDDLRPLSHRKPIIVYADTRTRREIETRFSYIFSHQGQGGGVPQIHLHDVKSEAVDCCGLEIVPVPLLHGRLPILGYRFGSCAYLTDCSEIPEESFARLHNLDVLIIDALRYRPHPTHFSIDEALTMIKRIAPRRAYLTHLCHDVDYGTLLQELPAGVEPAYDGLEFELD